MSSVSSLISKLRQWVTLHYTGGFGKLGIPPRPKQRLEVPIHHLKIFSSLMKDSF